jgi:hypothetical protein
MQVFPPHGAIVTASECTPTPSRLSRCPEMVKIPWAVGGFVTETN